MNIDKLNAFMSQKQNVYMFKVTDRYSVGMTFRQATDDGVYWYFGIFDNESAEYKKSEYSSYQGEIATKPFTEPTKKDAEGLVFNLFNLK